MQKPEGRLSPAQFEILESIWEIDSEGATSLQIWERISEKRKVARTTVIKLANRLEDRGWLERSEVEGTIVFVPTLPREQVEAEVAGDFVDCFFGGSASQFIMSLFGQEKTNPDEVERLRKIYEEQLAKRKSKRRRKRGK